MSLAALRSCRLNGTRPDGVVWVVIGPAPRWLDDDASVVVVPENAKPERTDWRPLVGLWVALFQTMPLADLTLRTLRELERVGAKLYGAADHTGAHPLVAQPTQDHRINLRRVWESLCKS